MFSDLEGDQDASDELPQLDDAFGDVDAASSRSVGAHDGTLLWLARGAESSSVCLVAFAGGEDWVVSCGGDTLEIDGAVGNFLVQPDDFPAPEGATKVSENVWAK